MRRRIHIMAATLLATALIGATIVNAQWLVPANSSFSCLVPNGSPLPDLAGGVVLSAPGGCGVSRYDANGYPVWTRVSMPNSVSQFYPDGKGGLIGIGGGSLGGDIFAARLTATGAIAWSITVSNAAGSQDSPASAADGFGGLVTAWVDH